MPPGGSIRNTSLSPDRESFAPAEAGRSPLQKTVRELALHAGFTEAGIVSLPYPETGRDAARFTDFLEKGRAGSMAYLARRNESGEPLRSRIDLPFPWARSVVVCMASYHADAPLSTAPAPPEAGWIARYAWSSRRDEKGAVRPSDYHKVLLKRLRELEAEMHAAFGEFESRAYVDTGPVIERNVARAAGLGWTGKNTCLIHPKLGSWNFLAVLVTALELPADEAPLTVPDRCGSCRRCLDACPTQALIEPYQMDATRCISYLTIEHRGEIGEDLKAGMGRQVFGCDICQDVCPWNRKAPITLGNPDLAPRQELINPDLAWLADLENADFERLFNGSPIRRAGFLGLRRNIAIAMGNSGLTRWAPWLKRWSLGEAQPETKPEPEPRRETGDGPVPDPAPDRAQAAVREAADWALRRLAVTGKQESAGS
jgi:epoxyqueuosine reductase